MGTVNQLNQQLYVVAKQFRMGGQDFHPGHPIDLSHIQDHKVSQLLRQRFIRPVDADSGDSTTQ